MDNFLARLRKPKTRQVSLFDFKSSDKLRHSGFTAEEERELIGFCLSDNYPSHAHG